MTRSHRLACAVVVCAAWLASCDDEVSAGRQCPTPYSGMATVEHPPDAGRASFYGTSCAPCDPNEELRLDEDGCPVFVTFAQCGGDVCLFGLRVAQPVTDAGIRDADTDDAGDDDDASAPRDARTPLPPDAAQQDAAQEDAG